MRASLLHGLLILLASGCGAQAANPALDAGPRDAGAAPDAGPCPAQMAWVAKDGGAVCVDRYEAALIAALADGGEEAWPPNAAIDGLSAGRVRAVPAEGIRPQAYVSALQGAAACEASGKRLCTLDEWLAACRGPDQRVYPYGDTHLAGACNEGRASNPVIDLFGAGATFSASELNDPRLDTLPDTVAEGGRFSRCVSSWGIYDLHGNVHEWIDATAAGGHGIFKGGFFVDANLNGHGCLYATTAHAKGYHDYSTGFRCCVNPRG